MAISSSVVQPPSSDRWWSRTLSPPHRSANKAIFAFILFATVFSSAVLAQAKKGTATADHLELISRATEHELHALERPTSFQFQERLEWSWGTETRSVIETPEGRV